MADQEEQKPGSPKAPSPTEISPAGDGDVQAQEEDKKADDAGRKSKSPVQEESGADANQNAGGDETQEQAETGKNTTY